MIQIYKTAEARVHLIEEIESGCWVCLSNPTASEILALSEHYLIDASHIRASLDEEEGARVEVEDNYVLIIVDIPTIEDKNGKDAYNTIPMSIILTEESIITVCLEDTPVLAAFADGRVRDFYTYKRTRFIFQILYRNTSVFLQALRVIEKKSEQIEERINVTQKNEEIIDLLNLEKSLIYFTTSLRANQMILQKLIKLDQIEQYPDDAELLEDVIIENKQAIEMSNIYVGVLRGTREAFSSVIANNQNIVMKFLTAATIIVAIPTMISGFMGMNVRIPLMESEYGFEIIIMIAAVVTIIITYFLAKKKML